MKTKYTRIEQIIYYCELHELTIVSYGLAPNPNGFCYELGERTCAANCDDLDKMLDALTSKEERELRTLIFGGAK
jgi:hypothetical protein